MKTSSFKIDMTNQIIGDWTVIKYLGYRKWECKCKCGLIKAVEGAALRSGFSQGCRRCRWVKTRLPVEDMIGKIFNKWIIVGYRIHEGGIQWECKCRCGQISYQEPTNLTKNKTKGCRKCFRRLPEGRSAFNEILGEYKRNARKRNIEWQLTESEFKELIDSNCFYTGLPPSSVKKKGSSRYTYNGIDRLDNSKGYYIGNCVPCLGRVNEMKMGSNYEDFITMCRAIVSHVGTKKATFENILKAV